MPQLAGGRRSGADAAALAALTTGPLADLPDPAPVSASELVFHGKVWDIRCETFQLDGHTLVREQVDHPGAVAVLAQDAEGRILLINQYRHPVGLRDWEIPAGLLDIPGEPPLATAKRELAEEVDLSAENWDELITFHTSPGGSNETLYLFTASGLTATEPFDRHEEEAQIVRRWVTLDEAVEAVLAGRLSNSILIVAVLTAHARRA
jgi:8-oxo-dGTP pyrophosphatase MutT (NUDIX family)